MADVVLNYSENEGYNFYNFVIPIYGSSRYFTAKNIEYVEDLSAEKIFYCPMRISQDVNKQRNYITNEVCELVRQKKMILLIDCSFEGNVKYIENWWESVCNYFKFTPDQVIFLTGAYAEHLYPDYNVIAVNLFEMKTVYEYKRQLPPLPTKYERKKFVCLNRLGKPHRTYFVLGMLERNLLDHAHWSYCNTDGAELTVPEVHRRLDHPMFEQTNSYSDQLISEFIDKVPHTPDGIISHDGHRQPEELFSNMYQNVDFMVIPETIYESTEGIFFTEKTFKAIVNGKPLVMLGQQGMIDKLRKRGYDTFDYIIDHSYDHAPDSKRAQMVLDETERLCNVDFSKFSDRIRESGEHNKRVALDESRYLLDIQHVHNRIFEIVQKNLTH